MVSDLKGRIYAAFYSDDLYDYAHSTPISLDFPTLPPLLQWVICPNDLIDSCSVNFVCVCLCFWCLIFSNLLLKIDSIDRICIIFFFVALRCPRRNNAFKFITIENRIAICPGPLKHPWSRFSTSAQGFSDVILK